jgi:CIC family chloride channel protein
MGGVSSLAFVKLIAYARPHLKALPRWTQYLQPAAAGLLIGVIGIWLPQVMGAGYGFIDQAMHDQFTWQILALLAMVKILSTSLSFVSGTPGGMFAPTLFIGAMLGGAVGAVEHHFFPWLSGGVGAYALVGMGTLFAGFLRVPLTSVFMVLEVSGNYSIILPVMISNTIAYLISRQYQETSLFDLLSRRDGMDLPSMEERREEIMVHVEDAMRKYQGTLLNIEDPLRWSLAQAEKSQEEFVIVEDGVGKWFGIKKEELRRQASAAREGASLRTVILDEPLPHVHPDHTLEEALRRLGDLPILPVVNRANFHKLEGVVGLPDILRAYHSAG